MFEGADYVCVHVCETRNVRLKNRPRPVPFFTTKVVGEGRVP